MFVTLTGQVPVMLTRCSSDCDSSRGVSCAHNINQNFNLSIVLEVLVVKGALEAALAIEFVWSWKQQSNNFSFVTKLSKVTTNVQLYLTTLLHLLTLGLAFVSAPPALDWSEPQLLQHQWDLVHTSLGVLETDVSAL